MEVWQTNADKTIRNYDPRTFQIKYVLKRHWPTSVAMAGVLVVWAPCLSLNHALSKHGITRPDVRTHTLRDTIERGVASLATMT